MPSVRYTDSFEKDPARLDVSIARRIIEKIEHLAQNPALGQPVSYLPKDLAGLKKYRIGDWRVLFWFDTQKDEIILYGIDHRSKVYKRFSLL